METEVKLRAGDRYRLEDKEGIHLIEVIYSNGWFGYRFPTGDPVAQKRWVKNTPEKPATWVPHPWVLEVEVDSLIDLYYKTR